MRNPKIRFGEAWITIVQVGPPKKLGLLKRLWYRVKYRSPRCGPQRVDGDDSVREWPTSSKPWAPASDAGSAAESGISSEEKGKRSAILEPSLDDAPTGTGQPTFKRPVPPSEEKEE